MLNPDAIDRKGWCPGALRPMLSGDGLIVRVRPLLGTLRLPELRALGAAAARFGNGQIDLTRRANLQLRGVTDATLAPLQHAIRDLGLLDAEAAAESVRNLMVSPLVGLDPAADDMRDVAAALSLRLEDDRALWALPGKFGFVVDGGGALDLAKERADIRLTAIENGARFAIGLDRPGRIEWLGAVARDAAADAAAAIAADFTGLANAHDRMRDLADPDIARIHARVAAQLAPLAQAPAHHGPTARVGLFAFDAAHMAVGIAAPFGRLEADQIDMLTTAAAQAGVSDIRLSPWRVLYAQVSDTASAHRLLDAAAAAGLIVSPDDPLLRIEACPGAPSCASTSLDTRATARILAAHWPAGFTGSVHVSGCAKGCARSAPSDLVLVGANDFYGIVRNGTPRDSFSGEASMADLAEHPDHIFRFKAHA